MKQCYKIFLISILFFHNASLAQVLVPNTDERVKHQLFLTTGLEPQWVSTLGYVYSPVNKHKDFNLSIGSSVKFPPLIVAEGSWRANLFSISTWKIKPKWTTSVFSSVFLAHSNNRAGNMNGLGLELRITPAYYGQKWVKGVEFGWQYNFLIHIRHSKEAKDTFSERYSQGQKSWDGPKDGWYASSSNRFRIGILFKRQIGSKISFQFSTGSLFSFQRQGILLAFSHAQFPFYAETSLLYWW